MENENKTKAQLIAELEQLRQRISELEKDSSNRPTKELGNSEIKGYTQ